MPGPPAARIVSAFHANVVVLKAVENNNEDETMTATLLTGIIPPVVKVGLLGLVEQNSFSYE